MAAHVQTLLVASFAIARVIGLVYDVKTLVICKIRSSLLFHVKDFS